MPKFQKAESSVIDDLKENGGPAKSTKDKRRSVVGIFTNYLKDSEYPLLEELVMNENDTSHLESALLGFFSTIKVEKKDGELRKAVYMEK